MSKVSKNSHTKQSRKTGVMPRFFVDERNGCIAIRDRQHPDFDVEHKGLDADLPDVVDFKMGEKIKFSKFVTWDLSPEVIENFKYKCNLLNKNNFLNK
jgi:hypothetical protein